jgi:uncharacterized protein
MIRYRWWCFGAAILLFAIAWPISQRLHLDRSLERMFPEKDPDRIAFELLESRFGVSNFLVFAYRDPLLWSEDGSGIERVAEIRKRIESIQGVQYALDVSRIDEMLSTLSGGSSFLGTGSGKPTHPLLDPKNRLAAAYRELFTGQTHARETDLVAIGVLLDANASKAAATAAEATSADTMAVENARASPEGASATLRELRILADQIPGGLLVGHLAMVDEGFREIEQDGRRLAIYSTFSLTLLMLFGFRSLRWAIITICVVHWSLVVTQAALVLLRWELTMVSSMLSSIVMVIGVATTMHWMLRYQREYDSAAHQLPSWERARTALQRSLASLWWPIVWACTTDAIGFGSLALSRVGPVQDYGSMMSVACGVVLMGIFLLVPTLALLGPWRTRERTATAMYALGEIPGEKWMQSGLDRILRSALAHRRWWLIGVFGVVIVAIAGSMRLQVETDFLKNFQSDSPIARAYGTVETELGGAGIWDVMVPAPKTITQAYFDLVELLEQDLRSIEIPGAAPARLTSALGLADTDRIARSAPVLSLVPIEARLFGMRQTMGRFFDTLLCEADGGRWMRIMLRAPERSDAHQKNLLIDQVKSTVQRHVASESWTRILESPATPPLSEPQWLAAGYYVLLTRLVEHVVADQWLSFFAATLGIACAMGFALRDWRLAIAGIVPAILPNLVVLGFLGWTGTRVNLGAAMIAAVSMGLGVDSSLHYLYRYQRERRDGKSWLEALRTAQSETGLAVLMATLALVIGFGSMAFSNFLPTVAFGTLAAWTMFGGLIGNLCVLPALLGFLEYGRTRMSASAPLAETGG